MSRSMNHLQQQQRQHQRGIAYMNGQRRFDPKTGRPLPLPGRGIDRAIGTAAGVAMGAAVGGPVGAVIGGVIGRYIS